MRYILLIYTDEARDATASPEDQATTMAAYTAFGESIKEQFVTGDALVPTTSATSVRVRNGEQLITDGPFAETKEQLGGYYVVNAANLDEAIGMAAKIPGAHYGTIEVRPIMEFN
jgi:hypothetical protein